MIMASKISIVLVEDEENDLIMTKRAFNQSGMDYRVESFTDGEQALDYLRGGCDLPDLILIDIRLLKMHGLELLEIIKKDDRLKGIKAVMLTGSDSDNHIDRAFELGAESYSIKPLTKDRFLQLIDELNLN